MPGLPPFCNVSPIGWGRVLALTPRKRRWGSARKVTARSSPRATSWPLSVARAIVVRGRSGADTARGLALNRLRAAREERGWSQSRLMYELGRLAGASGLAAPAREGLRIMISRWENGRVRPDGSYRRMLCRIYGQSPADLGLDVRAPVKSGTELEVWQVLPQLPHGHAVGPEVLTYLDTMFQTYAQADNCLGPRTALYAATQQVGFIEEQCHHAND